MKSKPTSHLLIPTNGTEPHPALPIREASKARSGVWIPLESDESLFSLRVGF